MYKTLTYFLSAFAFLTSTYGAVAADAVWFTTEGVQVGRRVGSDDGAFGDVYTIEGPNIPANAVVKLYRPAFNETGSRPPTREMMLAYYEGMQLVDHVLDDKAVTPYGLIEYNGIPGIVMERYSLEGFSFDVKYPSAKSPFVKRKTIEDIRWVFDALIEEKIYHHDMQFRVMPGGGIKLFDTDLAFRMDHPPSTFPSGEIPLALEQEMRAVAVDVLQRFITQNDLKELACYATRP